MFNFTHPKLIKLAEIEGFDDVVAMVEHSVMDSVIPAICVMPDCDQATESEPDQRGGYCEACGRKTVQSNLVICGMI